MKKKETKFESPGVFTIEPAQVYIDGHALQKNISEIKELIKQFPNDQDLGMELRRYAKEKL
jgi:hypothetical protein